MVEGVEVVAVVAASAREVHDRQKFLLFGLVARPHAFLPLAQNALHSAPRLSLEHQGAVAFLLQPAVDLVNMFLLSRPYFFGLVMVEDRLAGAK